MSRAAVAQALGLPERVIEQWETGKKGTPLLFAMAVARVVGVSVEHLRRRGEPPEPLAEEPRERPAPGIENLFFGFFPIKVDSGSKQLDLENFYSRY
jgi:DNA-binding XRE family transcriptional regulator